MSNELSILLYLVVFALSSWFISQSVKGDSWNKLMLVVGGAILILFSAGRFHVGTDSWTYINMFKRYASYSWSDFFTYAEFEWLFVAISKFCYTIGGRVLAWGVLSFLILCPVYKTLKENYPGICIGTAFFTFLCLFYASSFNVTREYIAVAIIFWGLQFVYNGRFFPFIITVIIAFSFHRSALLAIVIWFFWNQKKSQAIQGVRKWIIIAAALIAVFLYQEIIVWVSNNIGIFGDAESYAILDTSGGNRDFYVILFELVLVLVLKKYLTNVSGKAEFMVIMLTIAVLISLTGFSHPQVKRIAYYFSVPALTVLFGYIPKCIVRNQQTFAKILVYCFDGCILILTAYILRQGNLVPYQFNLFAEW